MFLPVLTPEEIIQQLDHGQRWAGAAITYRVARTTDGLTAENSETDGFIPASPYVVHYFELALGVWDDLIKVDFAKTDAASSDIEIAFSDEGVDYAHAYFTEYGGTMWLHPEYVGPDFSVGSYPFLAMTHEAGQALGLDQGCSLLPNACVVEHFVERERIAVQGLGDIALTVAAQQVQRELA
ncbi:hypothetical protein [Azohydromonas australica]|uniref:hypothetical protein n=1 Tax=Azohydromonas australica TaxID=364039 RepID=UPI001469CA36|nr:hypothetical protein [Azohydromonas australica]